MKTVTVGQDFKEYCQEQYKKMTKKDKQTISKLIKLNDLEVVKAVFLMKGTELRRLVTFGSPLLDRVSSGVLRKVHATSEWKNWVKAQGWKPSKRGSLSYTKIRKGK